MVLSHLGKNKQKTYIFVQKNRSYAEVLRVLISGWDDYDVIMFLYLLI